MRGVDHFHTDPHITSDGGHLAATLHRLAQDANANPDRVYARVASRLDELLSVRDVRVDRDEKRRLLTLEVQEKSDAYLPTRSLSDGTLRFLTLSIMEQDPEFTGLLCMEEPENGIHPARIPAMIDLLYDLSVNAHEQPGVQNPMRQVITATHSPFFVQAIYANHRSDLLHAETRRVKNPLDPESRPPVETIRCVPIRGSHHDETVRGAGMGSIMNYLTTPLGSNLQLNFPRSTEGITEDA
jgi:predicted ATPase